MTRHEKIVVIFILACALIGLATLYARKARQQTPEYPPGVSETKQS